MEPEYTSNTHLTLSLRKVSMWVCFICADFFFGSGTNHVLNETNKSTLKQYKQCESRENISCVSEVSSDKTTQCRAPRMRCSWTGFGAESKFWATMLLWEMWNFCVYVYVLAHLHLCVRYCEVRLLVCVCVCLCACTRVYVHPTAHWTLMRAALTASGSSPGKSATHSLYPLLLPVPLPPCSSVPPISSTFLFTFKAQCIWTYSFVTIFFPFYSTFILQNHYQLYPFAFSPSLFPYHSFSFSLVPLHLFSCLQTTSDAFPANLFSCPACHRLTFSLSPSSCIHFSSSWWAKAHATSWSTRSILCCLSSGTKPCD